MSKYLKAEKPANYHLTFSRSEINDKEVDAVLGLGGNVAVVFATKKGDALPRIYKRRRVIDGDLTDIRFNDPKNVVVGLRAKGDAINNGGNFVVR